MRNDVEVRAALQRAHVLIDLERWSDALAVLGPIVAGDPLHAQAWCLIARCRLGLDDLPGILQAGSAALQAAPDNEHAHRLNSIALSRLGHYGQALAAANESVRLAPNLWVAHMQRASVDLDAGFIGAPTRAAAERAVALAPHEPGAHVTLGRVAMAQDRRGDAVASYREALRLDPGNSAARNNLAVVALRRRRLASAGSHLMGALRANPHSAVAAGNLLIVLRSWLLLINMIGVLGCVVVEVSTDGSDVTELDAQGLTYVHHVPVTGHPVVVTVTAAVVAVLMTACLVTVRRSVGPQVWRLTRRAIGQAPVFGAAVVASLAGLAALVVGAVEGMPVARHLVTIAFALQVLAGLAIRLARRRRTPGGRRQAGQA